MSEWEIRMVTPQLMAPYRGQTVDVPRVPDVMVGEELELARNARRDEDTTHVLVRDAEGRCRAGSSQGHPCARPLLERLFWQRVRCASYETYHLLAASSLRQCPDLCQGGTDMSSHESLSDGNEAKLPMNTNRLLATVVFDGARNQARNQVGVPKGLPRFLPPNRWRQRIFINTRGAQCASLNRHGANQA